MSEQQKAKELIIISGKGGTGKTSLFCSLATLAKNKILVDCDVDAPDVHLILKPEILVSNEFYCGKNAVIDESKCVKCKRCLEVCKFGAISDDIAIDPINCEGCGACHFQCPMGAISLNDTKSGDWFESQTRVGKLVHARLGIAEENSGKLVSKIKNHARMLAKTEGAALILIDGSPGIGCPVIASISGADLVVVVVEPTISGLHDAKRVLELVKHFNAKACICINKFDINKTVTKEIEEFCNSINIDVVGKVSYNKVFTQAMMQELSVIEFSPESFISKEIEKVYSKIMELLHG